MILEIYIQVFQTLEIDKIKNLKSKRENLKSRKLLTFDKNIHVYHENGFSFTTASRSGISCKLVTGDEG